MGLCLLLSLSEGDLTLKLDFLGRSPPPPPPPPDAEDEEEGRLVREVEVDVSPLMTFSDCLKIRYNYIISRAYYHISNPKIKLP